MIKGFVSGKWYRYIGPGKETDDITWNENGQMDFLLDGKPHKCKEGNYSDASFFDSPDPNREWEFRRGLNYFEEVEMNDEMVQIEKLEKELARLKEIVETKKEKKIIYNPYHLYVGIRTLDGRPYILVGNSRVDSREDSFRFQSLTTVCGGWKRGLDSGQKAIDSATSGDTQLEIHEFHNRIEGMEFFMDKYRKYHKED